MTDLDALLSEMRRFFTHSDAERTAFDAYADEIRKVAPSRGQELDALTGNGMTVVPSPDAPGLREAAQAVVDEWQTGESDDYPEIAALRAALADREADRE